MSAATDEFEFFLNKAWSDGLPVVTPTEARVARMLSGTTRHADEMIGSIPPAMEPATVRTVATHAVMAGCKPEYLPVVLGGITRRMARHSICRIYCCVRGHPVRRSVDRHRRRAPRHGRVT